MRKPPPPPPPEPAEGLSREWPKLEAFGAEWVKRWLGLRERLVEIAKMLRRFTWMAEVIRQRPVGILHPYMIEVYVARGRVCSVPLPHPRRRLSAPKTAR
jgi:hypothetical protein